MCRNGLVSVSGLRGILVVVLGAASCLCLVWCRRRRLCRRHRRGGLCGSLCGIRCLVLCCGLGGSLLVVWPPAGGFFVAFVLLPSFSITAKAHTILPPALAESRSSSLITSKNATSTTTSKKTQYATNPVRDSTTPFYIPLLHQPAMPNNTHTTITVPNPPTPDSD